MEYLETINLGCMMKRVNKGNRCETHVTIVTFDKNVGASL